MDTGLSNSTTTVRESGLGAMLDFNFNTFITLSVIKILYVLGLCLIALVWLGAIASALISKNLLGALGVLLIGGVAAVVYMIFFRIWLEIIVVIFRIGENTSKLVELRSGSPNHPGEGT